MVEAAGPVRTGWTEVEKSFRWIAGRFSDFSGYDLDIITADVRGDLAYVVCWERAMLPWTANQDNVLRITHIYRREDGEWKNAHRHADPLTEDPWPTPTVTGTNPRIRGSN